MRCIPTNVNISTFHCGYKQDLGQSFAGGKSPIGPSDIVLMPLESYSNQRPSKRQRARSNAGCLSELQAVNLCRQVLFIFFSLISTDQRFSMIKFPFGGFADSNPVDVTEVSLAFCRV
jgi:hypothetical protein